MPLRSEDVDAARLLQIGAAQDNSDAIRLVAGPGTGKSSSIEERFRWLLEVQGIAIESVYGVSFTRAASVDLKLRVGRYLDDSGVVIDTDQLRISTLHSLALGLLSRANLLGAYPVRPRVMDEWEVENVFDAELIDGTGWGRRRAQDVRRAHEAFWNTGIAAPPGYIEPTPPVSDAERQAFVSFHGMTTQTYAAVLPGEIVRRCVENIDAGHLRLQEVADMAFLIVDEYQDLNPLDIRFVDQIAEDGVGIFAAGDDDQSIYSFRFAAPGGIQDFPTRHPGSGDHILEGCFRCAVAIVEAADALIVQFSPPTRITKNLESLWRTAAPPAAGTVMRWRLQSGSQEATAIAVSSRALLDAGLPARNVMILLSNKRLLPPIATALTSLGVLFTPPREDTWTDSDAGRFVLAMLRAVLDESDYLALRLILGCPRGIGIGTCASIVQKAATNLLNYRDLFFDAAHDNVFAGREIAAVRRARGVCAVLATFHAEDDLGTRAAEIRRLLVDARSEEEARPWDGLVETLPDETTLSETRDYISADNAEQQESVLKAIFERLEREVPDNLPEPRIRIMTMHGAKGLQADVVFIPALEEAIMPGPRRAVSPGLVLEGARLLYVSMTRARSALVMSLARQRMWQGTRTNPAPSRYATHVGGRFEDRAGGLSPTEAQAIVEDIRQMNQT
jgi:DNA helicase II / ATP-dependent DNA helicase PcrA